MLSLGSTFHNAMVAQHLSVKIVWTVFKQTLNELPKVELMVPLRDVVTCFIFLHTSPSLHILIWAPSVTKSSKHLSSLLLVQWKHVNTFIEATTKTFMTLVTHGIFYTWAQVQHVNTLVEATTKTLMTLVTRGICDT